MYSKIQSRYAQVGMLETYNRKEKGSNIGDDATNHVVFAIFFSHYRKISGRQEPTSKQTKAATFYIFFNAFLLIIRAFNAMCNPTMGSLELLTALLNRTEVTYSKASESRAKLTSG